MQFSFINFKCGANLNVCTISKADGLGINALSCFEITEKDVNSTQITQLLLCPEER